MIWTLVCRNRKNGVFFIPLILQINVSFSFLLFLTYVVFFIPIFLLSCDQRAFIKCPCLCGSLPSSIEQSLPLRACIVRQTMSMSIDTYKAYQLQKKTVKHHNAFKVQASSPFFGAILSETYNFSSFYISDVLLSQSILPNLPHNLCFAGDLSYVFLISSIISSYKLNYFYRLFLPLSPLS